jgi:peptidoglycan glycosyltransferase
VRQRAGARRADPRRRLPGVVGANARGAGATPAPGARAGADDAADATTDPAASPLMDRARFGLYPPGSTFKLVTAAAALGADADLARTRYVCRDLPGGRKGAVIDGRLVRDDEGHDAHGAIAMEEAMAFSCNAYFAQLGRAVGWPALRDLGRSFDLSMGDPQDDASRRAHAIEGAYGQAQVLATPLAMARVAATMAAGGTLPAPHVVRKPAPIAEGKDVVGQGAATAVSRMMRGVVARGTAQRLAAAEPAIAGKTGTAEIERGASHAWFIGYAPYGAPRGESRRRIAVSVLIENGGYGGGRATDLAGRIVAEARRLGII